MLIVYTIKYESYIKSYFISQKVARENESERLAFTERYVDYRRKLK